MKRANSKRVNIRYFLLFFMSILFALQLVILIPSSSIQASSNTTNSSYIIESFLKHYHFKSDGTIEVSSQIDIESLASMNRIAISIPHEPGQSLIIDSVNIGDINEDLTASNYVQKSQSPIATEAPETYFYETSGNSFDLTINAPFPSGTRKRVQIKYTVLSASTRFDDAAVSSLAIVSANSGGMIEELGLVFSFESQIYEEERIEFNFYERNNLSQVANTLHLLTLSDLRAYLEVPNETGVDIENDSFTIAAEDLVRQTSVNLRLVYPSDWIPLANITSRADTDISTWDLIREEEDAYTRTLYQIYEYRDTINIMIIGLMVVFVVIAAVNFILDFIRRRFDSKEQISSPPANTHPAVLAFLDKLEVTARIIWTIIYSLSAKKFIHLDDHKITRVYERLLPDVSELKPFEKAVLHWIWSKMEGENEIQLSSFYKKISENNVDNNERILRLSRLLEIECIEKSWLKINRQEGYNYTPLIIGVGYLVLAVIFSIIGAYYNPLVLVVPAIFLIGISLVSSQYTDEGLNIRRQTNAYSSYLSNIDRYVKRENDIDSGVSDEEKDLVLIQMIHSIAQDVDKDYLQALKYLYSIDEILNSRVIEFLGLRNTHRDIFNKLNNEKISLREQSAIYNQSHEQVEERIYKTQATLNRLNIASINPQRR